MRLAGRDRVVHGGHRRARHGGRRAASSARLMPSCGRPSGGIWQWPVAKCRGIGSDAERSLSKDRPRPIPIGIGCASADSCLLERRHLDLAAIGAADSWSSATPSSSSPAVGSRATEHPGMGDTRSGATSLLPCSLSRGGTANWPSKPNPAVSLTSTARLLKWTDRPSGDGPYRDWTRS